MGALWIVGVSCSCQPGALTDRSPSLQIAPSSIEFGPVLVGEEADRSTRIRNLSMESLAVKLGAAPPFFPEFERVDLAPGEERSLEIRFAPDAIARFQGELVVSAGNEIAGVRVEGLGAAPCPETKSCQVASLDPETGECHETSLPDGTRCDGGPCIEQGSCVAGECLGQAVVCDDGNPCTRDLCDPHAGCFSVEASDVCPQPENPCLVAVCDPQAGCATQVMQDGTPCGARDCEHVQICMQGECRWHRAPDDQRVGSAWTIIDPEEDAKVLIRPVGFHEEDSLWRITPRQSTLFAREIVSTTRDGTIQWRLASASFDRAFVSDGIVVTAGEPGEPILAHRPEDATTFWGHEDVPPDGLLRSVIGGGEYLSLIFSNRQLQVLDSLGGELLGSHTFEYIYRAFGNEAGWPILETFGGAPGERRVVMVDPVRGAHGEIPMGEGFRRLYAGYRGLYAGSISTMPGVERFALFEGGKRRVVGPFAPTPRSSWPGSLAPIVMDASSVWLVGSAPGCDGETRPACLYSSHLYRYDRSGALQWVRDLDGELTIGPILTDRGSVLLVTQPPGEFTAPTSEVLEIDRTGAVQLRCALDIPLRWNGFLQEDQLTATEIRHDGLNYFMLHGIRLPGLRPALEGWISPMGSFSRPWAPQPEPR